MIKYIHKKYENFMSMYGLNRFILLDVNYFSRDLKHPN